MRQGNLIYTFKHYIVVVFKHIAALTLLLVLDFFSMKKINVVLLQCCVLHVRLNWLFENVRTANVLQCYATIVYSSTYLL